MGGFSDAHPADARMKYFHIKYIRNLRLLPVDAKANGNVAAPAVTADRKVSELTWRSPQRPVRNEVAP